MSDEHLRAFQAVIAASHAVEAWEGKTDRYYLLRDIAEDVKQSKEGAASGKESGLIAHEV